MIFWRIYDELEQQQQTVEQQSCNSGLKSEVDRNNSTVSGQEIKNRLVSSNAFFAGDAFQIIEDMVKKGKLEKVALILTKGKKKAVAVMTTTNNKPRAFLYVPNLY